jgi:hypothetical protein
MSFTPLQNLPLNVSSGLKDKSSSENALILEDWQEDIVSPTLRLPLTYLKAFLLLFNEQ